MRSTSARLQRLRSILTALALLGSGASWAVASPTYSITDLGTLPGTTQSIATGINAQGQVVGISYSSSDGTWRDVGVRAPLGLSYDAGARSFLYGNGQMTQISPTDGPANAINDAGQVVGGHYSSINNQGQYVGGTFSSLVYQGQLNPVGGLVSGVTTTALNLLTPLTINDSGQIAGNLLGPFANYHHAAVYQNGHLTDYSQHYGLNGQSDYATLINNAGAVVVAEGPKLSGHDYHYLLFASKLFPYDVDLTSLPGGAGKVPLAMNNKNQIVGNDFLYAGGQFTSLQALLPTSSGWSHLNATGINDAGQIVGQGLIDGQESAFLMSVNQAQSVPEPTPLALLCLISVWGAFRFWSRGKAPAFT